MRKIFSNSKIKRMHQLELQNAKANSILSLLAPERKHATGYLGNARPKTSICFNQSSASNHLLLVLKPKLEVVTQWTCSMKFGIKVIVQCTPCKIICTECSRACFLLTVQEISLEGYYSGIQNIKQARSAKMFRPMISRKE